MTNKRFYIILTALVAFFLIVNVFLIQNNKIDYEELDFYEVLFVLDNEFLIQINDIRYFISVKPDTTIIDLNDNPLSIANISKGDFVYVEKQKQEFAFMVEPIMVLADKVIVKK